MIIGGFAVLAVGLVMGQIAVYKMITSLNNDGPLERRIPRWHAFVHFYSNDVINLYRRSHSDGPLNMLLKVCWIFLALGFVMVIGSHFVAPKSL
jgi:hypothetical protein